MKGSAIKIHIKNFCGYRDVKYSFSIGMVGVIGKAMSGKTTIFEAISWVLYNKPQGIAPFGFNQAKTYVRLELKSITITRTRNPSTIKISLDNEQTYQSKEAEAQIESLFGSYSVWQTSCYITQMQLHHIFTCPEKQLSGLMEELFLRSNANEIIKNIEEHLRSATQECEHKSKGYEKLEKEFNSNYESEDSIVTVDKKDYLAARKELPQIISSEKELCLKSEEEKAQKTIKSTLIKELEKLRSLLRPGAAEELFRIEEELPSLNISYEESLKRIALDKQIKEVEGKLENIKVNDLPRSDTLIQKIQELETEHQLLESTLRYLDLKKQYDDISINHGLENVKDLESHISKLEDIESRLLKRLLKRSEYEFLLDKYPVKLLTDIHLDEHLSNLDKYRRYLKLKKEVDKCSALDTYDVTDHHVFLPIKNIYSKIYPLLIKYPRLHTVGRSATPLSEEGGTDYIEQQKKLILRDQNRILCDKIRSLPHPELKLLSDDHELQHLLSQIEKQSRCPKCDIPLLYRNGVIEEAQTIPYKVDKLRELMSISKMLFKSRLTVEQVLDICLLEGKVEIDVKDLNILGEYGNIEDVIKNRELIEPSKLDTIIEYEKLKHIEDKYQDAPIKELLDNKYKASELLVSQEKYHDLLKYEHEEAKYYPEKQDIEDIRKEINDYKERVYSANIGIKTTKENKARKLKLEKQLSELNPSISPDIISYDDLKIKIKDTYKRLSALRSSYQQSVVNDKQRTSHDLLCKEHLGLKKSLESYSNSKISNPGTLKSHIEDIKARIPNLKKEVKRHEDTMEKIYIKEGALKSLNLDGYISKHEQHVSLRVHIESLINNYKIYVRYAQDKDNLDMSKEELEIITKRRNNLELLLHKANMKKREMIEETLDHVNDSLERIVELLMPQPIQIQITMFKSTAKGEKRDQVGISYDYGGVQLNKNKRFCGSEKNLLSLALVLTFHQLSKFPILILDECLGGMDSDLQDHVLEQLQEINQDLGGTMLIVTHNSNEGLFDNTIRVKKDK